jgi:hypothetical protein
MQRLLLLRGRPQQRPPPPLMVGTRGLASSSGVVKRRRRPRGMPRLELVLGKPGSGKTALVCVCVYVYMCIYIRPWHRIGVCPAPMPALLTCWSIGPPIHPYIHTLAALTYPMNPPTPLYPYNTKKIYITGGRAAAGAGGAGAKRAGALPHGAGPGPRRGKFDVTFILVGLGLFDRSVGQWGTADETILSYIHTPSHPTQPNTTKTNKTKHRITPSATYP